MKLFNLSPDYGLGRKIAEELELAVTPHEDRSFEDGEFKLRPLESARDEHCVVCQALSSHGALNVSERLLRLMFFAGALKDAGAARVTALLPYLAFSRKDRRTKQRDPVTTRYLAGMLEAVGTDEVITLDVHNVAALENAFRIGTENLDCARLMAEHFLARLPADRELVVMSPDAGGVKRARHFLDVVESRGRSGRLAFMEKQRSGGRVTGEAFAGDVNNALVVIFDDLISGGTTMLRSARACRARGAREVHAAAAHGVFGEGAEGNLAADELDSVVVTDTIADAAERCSGVRGKLTVLQSAPLFAEALRRRRT